MTITAEIFVRTLNGMQQLLPFGKRLDEAALLLAWQTLPATAKEQLTTGMLVWAAGQFLQDPAPPKEQPTHLVLLRYLYRLENGRPNYEWGLKQDLPQRMAADGQFFPPEPLSEAARIAAGELPDHDGPRHSPGGVLSGFLSGGAS